MAARIFGKRNILVNNQSDRDRFLDFVLEFPGSKRGKGERERERSACLPRVYACTRQLTAGVFAGKWKLDERRALATGPFTAAHAEESSAFGDREREKKKKRRRRKERPIARRAFFLSS